MSPEEGGGGGVQFPVWLPSRFPNIGPLGAVAHEILFRDCEP